MKLQFTKAPVLLIGLFYLTSLHAQTAFYETGITSFFDNREFNSNYTNHKTMAGSIGLLSGGLKIDSSHYIVGGVNYLIEFGDRFRSENVFPVLYYRYLNEKTDVILGSFPRIKTPQPPLYFLNDSISYFRPNIEGISIRYNNKNTRHIIWLDWLTRQSDSVKESFLIGGQSDFYLKNFMFQFNFSMYHLANTAIYNPNEHITDNGGASFLLGYDFSKNNFFDSLVVKSGFIFSYYRLRTITDINLYYGAYSEIYMKYKKLAIRSTNYFGDGIIQLNGLKLFAAEYYSRMDFIWHVFNNKFVDGKVEFGLHFLPGDVDTSQLFKVCVYLNNLR